jgi:hypothetical protein
MRWFALLALTLVAIASGASASASTAPKTSLTIAFWDDGVLSRDPVTWTLRCRPARGTLRHPGIACYRIAAGGWKLFAPVPKNVACTQIYGGPQVARISGFVKGRRVWAMVNRTDGCNIARWDRLSPWLLPRGGASS